MNIDPRYYALTPQDQLIVLAHNLSNYLLKRPITLQTSKRVQLILRLADDLRHLVHYIPLLTFTTQEVTTMAKNIPSFNLIEYRLTDSELESFDDWTAKTLPTISTALAYFAEKNYKVSFTFVENSNSWCVSVTGKEDAKFNSKATLTTWGEDPLEAVVMALYKISVIFSGGVWKTRTESRRG